MKACVVIPARGQPNISRAIGSVFAQRHEDWVCVVIGKAEIKNFLAADKRDVFYSRLLHPYDVFRGFGSAACARFYR